MPSDAELQLCWWALKKSCHYTDKYASSAQWGWPVGMGHERWGITTQQWFPWDLNWQNTHTHTQDYDHVAKALSPAFTHLHSCLQEEAGQINTQFSSVVHLLFVHPFLSSTSSLGQLVSPILDTGTSGSLYILYSFIKTIGGISSCLSLNFGT